MHTGSATCISVEPMMMCTLVVLDVFVCRLHV